MIEVPNPYHLGVAILAAWAAIHVWKNGSIFEEIQEQLKYSSWRLAEVLRCPLCLTPWVSWLFVVILNWFPKPPDGYTDLVVFLFVYVCRLFVIGLAVAGGVYFLRLFFEKLDR